MQSFLLSYLLEFLLTEKQVFVQVEMRVFSPDRSPCVMYSASEIIGVPASVNSGVSAGVQ